MAVDSNRFEEARLNGSLTAADLLAARPASEWLVMHPLHGPHAEVLVNYLFYIDYDRVRGDACRLILHLLTTTATSDAAIGDDALLEREPTYVNPHPDVPIKLAVFLELAHGPHGAPALRNVIYACMDELLFETRAIPYTLQRMPDCSILKSMTIVYDNGMMSNKREIHRKFRFLDDQNIDLVAILIKICFKLMGPKKITPKEYCKLIGRACAFDPAVCEFIIKMLLVHMVSHTAAVVLAGKPYLGLAGALFQPAFMGGSMRASDVINSRVDKYRLFNGSVSRSEFMSVLTLENAPLILALMREAYRFTRYKPVPEMGVTQMITASHAFDPAIDLDDDMEEHAGDMSEDEEDDKSEDDRSEDDQSEDGEETGEIGGPLGVRALSKIIETCEGINYSSYRESPSDATPGKEYMMPNPNPLLAPDRMEVMRRCLLPKASIMDEAFWLVCFGVPIPDIVCMHRMVRLNSSAVRTYLLELYNNHRAVYAVLFSYFLLLDENALCYEVDGDLDMWVKHTQAAASHYHLKDGDEIPIVVGRVLACDNCRDVKHPSFYFRKVKAQINGTGKILTTATCLFCAKEPKAGAWQDQYIIDHKERAPGAMMTICGPSKFMIGAPRPAGEIEAEPSLVHRRKFGKFISTQIKLHKCADQELRVLTILGRFTVYDGIIYTGCYGCLRFSPLEDLIYYGEDIMCEDCVQEKLDETVKLNLYSHASTTQRLLKGGKRAADAPTTMTAPGKPKQPRIMCAYCNKDITVLHRKMVETAAGGVGGMPGGGVKSFFLYVDNVAKPEFQTVYFCGSHNNMRWVTQYNVPFLSLVLRGIKHRWGMRNPDGSLIAVGPLTGEAGLRFSKATL
jgi:hypothetical protein